MLIIIKSIKVCVLTFVLNSFFVSHILADRGQVVRANSDGLTSCQLLKSTDVSIWRAKVRGALLDSNKGGTDFRFRITSCFSTQDECKTYIDNIDQIIDGSEAITSRKCSLIN